MWVQPARSTLVQYPSGSRKTSLSNRKRVAELNARTADLTGKKTPDAAVIYSPSRFLIKKDERKKKRFAWGEDKTSGEPDGGYLRWGSVTRAGGLNDTVRKREGVPGGGKSTFERGPVHQP